MEQYTRPATIDPLTGRALPGALVRNFDSIVEFGRYVEACEPLHGAGTGSDKRASHDWTLGMDLPGAFAMARTGGRWEEGTARLRAALDETQQFVSRGASKQVALRVAGFAPSVPAYLAGHPANMLARVSGPRAKARVIRVGVNLSLGADVKAHEVMNRGAAILSVIDELEASDLRVELVGSYCANEESVNAPSGAASEWYANVKVKDSGDQWNPASAAFVLCHPALCRRLGLRLKESCEWTLASTWSGYGSGTGVRGEGFDLWFPRLTEGSYYRTAEKAMDTVRKIVAKRIDQITHEEAA
jgi:hypothetical protein